jgi:hypothetical protein
MNPLTMTPILPGTANELVIVGTTTCPPAAHEHACQDNSVSSCDDGGSWTDAPSPSPSPLGDASTVMRTATISTATMLEPGLKDHRPPWRGLVAITFG